MFRNTHVKQFHVYHFGCARKEVLSHITYRHLQQMTKAGLPPVLWWRALQPCCENRISLWYIALIQFWWCSLCLQWNIYIRTITGHKFLVLEGISELPSSISLDIWNLQTCVWTSIPLQCLGNIAISCIVCFIVQSLSSLSVLCCDQRKPASAQLVYLPSMFKQCRHETLPIPYSSYLHFKVFLPISLCYFS